MSKKFSASTGGFYATEIHGNNIPADAVDITDEQHAALLAGQASGKIISADANGHPVLTDPAPPTLAESIAALIRQIDADADAIYTAALGNRATEYAEAEAQAQAFKDAGYAGAAPAYVQAWSDATGKTAQWAADDILATAAAWRAAQTSIRVNRLARKEAARKAAGVAALAPVTAAWQAFVVAIKAQLGLAE